MLIKLLRNVFSESEAPKTKYKSQTNITDGHAFFWPGSAFFDRSIYLLRTGLPEVLNDEKKNEGLIWWEKSIKWWENSIIFGLVGH